jgi:glycosyltransferase involved in cell wall biosynthesis
LIVTLSANIMGKGLHVLSQAWPSIVQVMPEARWLLCGPQSTWLREAVLPGLGEAGVRSTVIMTGALSGDAVFEHLACADLHVNPSLCEGLNMVTVEAAAVGTPTITTSATGIAAWSERYEAGAVVPAGNGTALSSAIISAFSKPGCLAAWSAAAIQMSDEFDPDCVARDLLDLLPSAINLSSQAK